MNREQLEALRALNVALGVCSDLSVLDELAALIHPDIINQFCDAVLEAARRKSTTNSPSLGVEP